MTEFSEMPATQEMVSLLENKITEADASILEREQGNRHGSWQHQCKIGEENDIHRYITLSLTPDQNGESQTATLQVNVGAEHVEGFLGEPVDRLEGIRLDQPTLEDREELWLEAVAGQALRKAQNLDLSDLTSARESFSRRR